MKNILFKLFLVLVVIPFVSIMVGVRVGEINGVAFGVVASFIALSVMLNPVVLSLRGQCLGDNVIPAGLNLDVILDSALEEFHQVILPVTAFCHVFRDVVLKGTNKVVVPYYPLQTTASRDFNGTYLFDGTNTELRDVTVDRRKYQSLAMTSAELARYPALNAEQLGRLKGRKLAEDVIADIFSVVTEANYGDPIFTGAASTFDLDDVADVRTALNAANWPKIGRTLILDTDYDGRLVKDDPLLFANQSGDGGAQMRSGRVRSIMGFENYFDTNMIPENGEDLIGMAVFMSAILVAFSPIEPAPDVRKNMSDYRAVTEEDGLTIEYRSWGDPDSDTAKKVIECNYGFEKGDENALKRFTRA